MQVLESKRIRIIGVIGLLVLAAVVGAYFYTSNQPEEVKTVRAAHSTPAHVVA